MPPRQRQHLASIVGANIAALRAKRGWNQTQLAEKLGMGPDSLSRMERGMVAPRFARLELIAEALTCTVAELFFTAEDRARMTPAAWASDTYPTAEQTQQGRRSYRLAEDTAPYGEYPAGGEADYPAANTDRSLDHSTIEEAIFMAERIVALLKQ